MFVFCLRPCLECCRMLSDLITPLQPFALTCCEAFRLDYGYHYRITLSVFILDGYQYHVVLLSHVSIQIMPLNIARLSPVRPVSLVQ